MADTHKMLPYDPAADVPGFINLPGGILHAQILHALAALGIPDHLADDALTAEEMAERARTHPQSTYRLMRAAASVDVLRYEADRRFSLTGKGHLLRTGLPGPSAPSRWPKPDTRTGNPGRCFPNRCAREPGRRSRCWGRTSSTTTHGRKTPEKQRCSPSRWPTCPP